MALALKKTPSAKLMNSFQLVLGIFKEHVSEKDRIKAAKLLGMSEAKYSTLRELLDNPNSLARKELNKKIFNANIQFANQQELNTLIALLMHSAKELEKIRESMVAEAAAERAKNNPVADDDEPTFKQENEEEKALNQKLVEINNKIQKIKKEIDIIDAKIIQKEKEILTTASEVQINHTKEIDIAYNNFLEKIKHDPAISAEAIESSQQLKDLKYLQENRADLINRTNEQITNLTSPNGLQITQGASFSMLLQKMLLIDNMSDVGHRAQLQKAAEIIKISRLKNNENIFSTENPKPANPKIEDLTLQELKNEYERLEKIINGEEHKSLEKIINGIEPYPQEIFDKYSKVSNDFFEISKRRNYVMNYFAGKNEQKEVMIATLIVNSLALLPTKNIKEHSAQMQQAHDATKALLAEKQNSAQALENTVGEKADVISNIREAQTATLTHKVTQPGSKQKDKQSLEITPETKETERQTIQPGRRTS